MASSEQTTETKRSGLQLIGRAADVLRALEAAPEGLALSELAATVELPKSTVHRLVGALDAEDFVTVGSDAKWRLGRGLAQLGAAARGSLREDLRPHLMRLAKAVDETVDLSVLDGAGARFIDQIPSTHRLLAVSAVGVSFPLHCTANGKALLAAMPNEQATVLLPARLASYTENTITARKQLWEEIATVREAGVAYDREEHTERITAVGAVVRDAYGVAAAISVAAPTRRFNKEEDALTRQLRQTCAEASATLGG